MSTLYYRYITVVFLKDPFNISCILFVVIQFSKGTLVLVKVSRAELFIYGG